MKQLKIAGFCALAFLAIFVFAIQVRADAPPALEAGWNLASTPCDVTVADIKDKLHLDVFEAFEWNGANYAPVDTLKRGIGYAINSDRNMDTAGLCNASSEKAPVMIKFHKGWNLMGNPYHSALSFVDAFGDNSSQIADLMFELKDGRYQPLLKSDKILVWRAVWVFAFEDITVDYNFNCDSLALTLLSPNQPTLVIGDQASFSAICAIGDANYDLTQQVKWTLSAPATLEAGSPGGDYTAAAAGICDVSASFKEARSNTIRITVTNPKPVLASIKLTSTLLQLKTGATSKLTVTGTYSDSSAADITDQASFLLSNANAGSVANAVFTAAQQGATDVTASVGELKSNIVRITVQPPEPDVRYVYLIVRPYTIQIHETAALQVYAYYTDGRALDVTTQAAISFDTTLGHLEGSKFYPAKLGYVQFTATYKGVTSSLAPLSIVKKQLIWIGIYADAFVDPSMLPGAAVAPCREPYRDRMCAANALKPLPCPSSYSSCYTNDYMQNGSTGKYIAYADFNDGTYDLDVTDTIEQWEVTDTSILEILDGGVVTAHKTGTVGVRAYKDGVWSEWSWVKVVDESTNKFMLLELSNRETIVEAGKSITVHATYYERAASVQTYYVHGNFVGDGEFKSEKVTEKAAWTLSNAGIGGFDASKAKFTGAAAGTTDISASYNDVTSNSAELEVWKPANVNYCDPNNLNESTWTDNLTIAQLSTDCASYGQTQQVTVSFSALLDDQSRRRALDVCLDLYIYDSNQKLVRTFRDTNCSPEPLYRAVSGYKPVFEYTAQWDRKDDNGDIVPPGDYTAIARYYILYCPVLKVNFKLTD